MIQKYKICLWILLLSKIVSGTDEYQQSHFPKIIWSYWHQGQQQASTFTKMCINNHRYYAQKSGWSYRLLSKYNIHEYLNIQEVERIWKMNGVNLLQPKADIIRMMLLLKYGGMWLDTNSFFIEDLKWLDTLKMEPHIYNKVGQRPEILLGSFSSDDIYLEYDSLAEPEKVYPLPNLQVWFMVAMPNSTFYQQVMKTIEKVASMGRIAANQYYSALGVHQRFNYTDYFLMSNYIFQIVIQLKDIELQKSTNNNSMHAINYYKIWNLQAAKTAFLLLNFHKFRVSSSIIALFQKSLQFYRQKLRGPRYFVKLVGQFYQKANQILDNYEENMCLGIGSQIKIGSFIDQFLFAHSKDILQIKKITQIMHQKQINILSKCQFTDPNHKRGIKIFFKYLIPTFLLIVFFMIYKFIFWKEHNKDS